MDPPQKIVNNKTSPSPNGGEEKLQEPKPDPEFDKRMQGETEKLKKTLEKENNGYEVIDWEKETKKYREELAREERETEDMKLPSH